MRYLLLFVTGLVMCLEISLAQTEDSREGNTTLYSSPTFQLSLSPQFSLHGSANDNRGFVTLPIDFSARFPSQGIVRGEMILAFSPVFLNIAESEYGAATVGMVGIRFDDVLPLFDGSVSARIALHNTVSGFDRVVYKQQNAAIAIDFKQTLPLLRKDKFDVDLGLIEGILFIPAKDISIPSLNIALTFNSFFTFGVDVASFWQPPERTLLRFRPLLR